MAIAIKTGNYPFLGKLGIVNSVIDQLKNASVKVTLANDVVAFRAANGQVAGAVTLPWPVSSIAEEKSSHELAAIASEIEKYILSDILPKAAGSVHLGVPTMLVIDSDAYQGVTSTHEKPNPVKFGSDKQQALHEAINAIANQQHVKLGPAQAGTIPLLRDATYMYQRVKGTSTDAKYFVVAMNKDIKLAAKIEGMALALRAEGEIKKYVPQLLKAKLEVKTKENYMSGHFQCSENAPPSHLLGSLLTAMEIEFVTPMPTIQKLKELSSHG